MWMVLVMEAQRSTHVNSSGGDVSDSRIGSVRRWRTRVQYTPNTVLMKESVDGLVTGRCWEGDDGSEQMEDRPDQSFACW
jgi:hypothetical protein